MSYTKRTCVHCGFRDIQPNMRQASIQYNSGTSEKKISKGSLVGAFLGDKRSAYQVQDSMFGVSKRQYKRNKEVWICRNCNDNGSRRSNSKIARSWRLFKSLVRLTWIILTRGAIIAAVAFFFLALQGVI